MQLWKPRFELYETSCDGARVIVGLDIAALQHAPLASHSVRLELRVKMLQPRPDGLRGNEEAQALAALEEQLARELEVDLQAVYVGRLTSGGYVEHIFYVPGPQADAARNRLHDLDVGLYHVEASIEPDADWARYKQMYPDTRAMWTIWNRWLVDKLKERGDPLEVEREVDHLVRLPSADKAAAAGAALTAAGFRVDPLRPPNEQGELWVLEFHRNERCDGRHPNRFVFEVLDVVLPLDGDYDGWATGIPKLPKA